MSEQPTLAEQAAAWLLEHHGIELTDWQSAALEALFAEVAVPDEDHEWRRLPSDTVRCDRCGDQIVWAVTVARETGPGGKLMPLDPIEDPAGRVAVSPGAHGRLMARALKKDEEPIVPVEYRAMAHFGTCGRS